MNMMTRDEIWTHPRKYALCKGGYYAHLRIMSLFFTIKKKKAKANGSTYCNNEEFSLIGEDINANLTSLINN